MGKVLKGFLIAAIVAMVALLIVWLSRDNAEERVMTEQMEEIDDEIRQYRVELRTLESELAALERAIPYESEHAEFMIGFAVSDLLDLTYVREKAQEYAISPVLVLDCSLDLADLKSFADAADPLWEIMLTASDFTQEANETVRAMLTYLEENGQEDCGMFLLRGDQIEEENLQMIRDDGFLGYTIYNSEQPAAGQTEEGDVYFDYSYIQSTGSTVADRLAACYNLKAALIVVFDMERWNAGAISDSYVNRVLNTVQIYAEEEDCSFSSVAEVVGKLALINETVEERTQESAESMELLQERIDELEEIIATIYDRLEY